MSLLFFVASAACRAGGGSSGSSSPAASVGALESSLQGFGAAFQAVAVGLTGAFTQGTNPGGEVTDYKHTLLCDTAGPENEGTSNIETRISDRALDGTFLVSSNLKNCGDVDGDVDAVGSFTRGVSAVTLAWDYSGALKSGDCDVDISDLSVTSALQDPLAPSFVSGTLTSHCADGSDVECRWSQTPATDQASLLAECACSGNGC